MEAGTIVDPQNSTDRASHGTHGPTEHLSDRAACPGALARTLFGAANGALSVGRDRHEECRHEHGRNDLAVHKTLCWIVRLNKDNAESRALFRCHPATLEL